MTEWVVVKKSKEITDFLNKFDNFDMAKFHQKTYSIMPNEGNLTSQISGDPLSLFLDWHRLNVFLNNEQINKKIASHLLANSENPTTTNQKIMDVIDKFSTHKGIRGCIKDFANQIDFFYVPLTDMLTLFNMKREDGSTIKFSSTPKTEVTNNGDTKYKEEEFKFYKIDEVYYFEAVIPIYTLDILKGMHGTTYCFSTDKNLIIQRDIMDKVHVEKNIEPILYAKYKICMTPIGENQVYLEVDSFEITGKNHPLINKIAQEAELPGLPTFKDQSSYVLGCYKDSKTKEMEYEFFFDEKTVAKFQTIFNKLRQWSKDFDATIITDFVIFNQELAQKIKEILTLKHDASTDDLIPAYENLFQQANLTENDYEKLKAISEYLEKSGGIQDFTFVTISGAAEYYLQQKNEADITNQAKKAKKIDVKNKHIGNQKTIYNFKRTINQANEFAQQFSLPMHQVIESLEAEDSDAKLIPQLLYIANLFKNSHDKSRMSTELCIEKISHFLRLEVQNLNLLSTFESDIKNIDIKNIKKTRLNSKLQKQLKEDLELGISLLKKCVTQATLPNSTIIVNDNILEFEQPRMGVDESFNDSGDSSDESVTSSNNTSMDSIESLATLEEQSSTHFEDEPLGATNQQREFKTKIYAALKDPISSYTQAVILPLVEATNNMTDKNFSNKLQTSLKIFEKEIKEEVSHAKKIEQVFSGENSRVVNNTSKQILYVNSSEWSQQEKLAETKNYKKENTKLSRNENIILAVSIVAAAAVGFIAGAVVVGAVTGGLGAIPGALAGAVTGASLVVTGTTVGAAVGGGLGSSLAAALSSLGIFRLSPTRKNQAIKDVAEISKQQLKAEVKKNQTLSEQDCYAAKSA